MGANKDFSNTWPQLAWLDQAKFLSLKVSSKPTKLVASFEHSVCHRRFQVKISNF
jgi:hypothetical protein